MAALLLFVVLNGLCGHRFSSSGSHEFALAFPPANARGDWPGALATERVVSGTRHSAERHIGRTEETLKTPTGSTSSMVRVALMLHSGGWD